MTPLVRFDCVAQACARFVSAVVESNVNVKSVHSFREATCFVVMMEREVLCDSCPRNPLIGALNMDQFAPIVGPDDLLVDSISALESTVETWCD